MTHREKKVPLETEGGGYLKQIKGMNPLFVLPKIRCGMCGKKQLSQICKPCREKNQNIIDGVQETLT